jgi:hypothetical protein
MTNLPVFEDLSGDLYIQISASELQISQKLFVAAANLGADKIKDFNPAEIVQVRFGNVTITVFFLLIASIPAALVSARFKEIGRLEETDSINILNNLRDILAWP